MNHSLEQGFVTLQVSTVLRYAWRRKEFVHYNDLTWAIPAHTWSKKVAQALADLMDEDFAEGRPFRSALVIGTKTGMPGKGFFTKLSDLGVQVGDPREYWEGQCRELLGENVTFPEKRS